MHGCTLVVAVANSFLLGSKGFLFISLPPPPPPLRHPFLQITTGIQVWSSACISYRYSIYFENHGRFSSSLSSCSMLAGSLFEPKEANKKGGKVLVTEKKEEPISCICSMSCDLSIQVYRIYTYKKRGLVKYFDDLSIFFLRFSSFNFFLLYFFSISDYLEIGCTKFFFFSSIWLLSRKLFIASCRTACKITICVIDSHIKKIKIKDVKN